MVNRRDAKQFTARPAALSRKSVDKEKLQSKLVELKLNGTTITLHGLYMGTRKSSYATLHVPGFDCNYIFNAYLPFGERQICYCYGSQYIHFPSLLPPDFLTGNYISVEHCLGPKASRSCLPLPLPTLHLPHAMVSLSGQVTQAWPLSFLLLGTLDLVHVKQGRRGISEVRLPTVVPGIITVLTAKPLLCFTYHDPSLQFSHGFCCAKSVLSASHQFQESQIISP